VSGRGGKRPALWALILVLALAGGLRFWNLGRPALIGDEAYYRLWADRLALCYYDNPAGVALLVRAGSALAPASEWGTRWFNALLGVISAALVCALGWRLFSPWPGVVGGAVFAVGAPTVLVGRFVYTDTLYITLLLSTTLALLPFAQRDR